MSDQADTCGMKATRELEEWRQRSEESSSEHLAKSSVVRHLEKKDQEGGDSASTGDDQ